MCMALRKSWLPDYWKQKLSLVNGLYYVTAQNSFQIQWFIWFQHNDNGAKQSFHTNDDQNNGGGGDCKLIRSYYETEKPILLTLNGMRF